MTSWVWEVKKRKGCGGGRGENHLENGREFGGIKRWLVQGGYCMNGNIQGLLRGIFKDFLPCWSSVRRRFWLVS